MRLLLLAAACLVTALPATASAKTASEDYSTMGKYTYSDSRCQKIVDPIGIIFEGDSQLKLKHVFGAMANNVGWGSSFGTDQYHYANGRCTSMDGESRDNYATSSRSHLRLNGFSFRTSRYQAGPVHAFAASPHTEKVRKCPNGHFGRKHAVVPTGFRDAQQEVVGDFKAKGYQVESFAANNRKPRRQCDGAIARGTGRTYVINLFSEPSQQPGG